MLRNISIFFLLLISSTITIKAQELSRISGQVIDKSDNKPISFADISLISESDSLYVYHSFSDEKGNFSLDSIPYGNYWFQGGYMGEIYLSGLQVEVNTEDHQLGTMAFDLSSIALDEVKIKSGKPAIQYKVDRQIINADSFPEAAVAMDLMENVPSVQVDVNGNLSYRGDGKFIVLLNGHRVPNGTEKLRQIPANQIERIEVITNPPAQYASEGTAGIIQVILKKNRLQGYAVNANTRANTLGGISGYFSIDKKSEKSGWYVNANGGRNIWSQSDYFQEQTVDENELIYRTTSREQRKNGQDQFWIEAGFNYDLSDKDYIDASLYINPVKVNGFFESDGEVGTSVFDRDWNLLEDSEYRLKTDRFEKYHYLGGTFTYERGFNEEKSHKLAFFSDIAYFLGPYSERHIDQKIYPGETIKTGYTGFENNEFVLNLKLDYSLPLSEKSSLEAGIHSMLDHIPEIGTENGNFDENNNIIPFSADRREQKIDFAQDVYAGYVTFKSSWGKLDYQLGMRIENTGIKSNYTYISSDDEFIEVPAKNNFTDLFPSLHLLYNISEKSQIVANYTRRINRPGYSMLVPYVQYSSITSYYQGNADVKPSYVNAYELGFKQNWTPKNYLSFQLFHRKTSGVTDNYQYAGNEGWVMAVSGNVGDSYSTGSEIMSNMKMSKWWETNLSTSLFFYLLKVNVGEDRYNQEQFNYNVKWNNTFTLPSDFTVRFNLHYNGPRKTSQSEIKAFFNATASVKKSFMDDKWAITLTGSNIFNTNRTHYITQGNGFSNIIQYDYKPYVSLMLAYKLDNQN